jgi:hypothetical protein
MTKANQEIYKRCFLREKDLEIYWLKIHVPTISSCPFGFLEITRHA